MVNHQENKPQGGADKMEGVASLWAVQGDVGFHLDGHLDGGWVMCEVRKVRFHVFNVKRLLPSPNPFLYAN